MDGWELVLVGAAIVLAPFYLYLVSKWVQVGRLSGTHWFAQRCRKERSNGKR